KRERPPRAKRLLELEAPGRELRAADDFALRIERTERLEVVAANTVVAARKEAHRRRQLVERALQRHADVPAHEHAGLPQRPDPFTLRDRLHEARVGAEHVARGTRLERQTRAAARSDRVVGAHARPIDARHQQSRATDLTGDFEIFDAQRHDLRPRPSAGPLEYAARAELEAFAFGGLRVLALDAAIEAQPLGLRAAEREPVVRGHLGDDGRQLSVDAELMAAIVEPPIVA